MQPLGCGEFATFVAGEFARFASRRICGQWPRRFKITVVPECLCRESSGLGLCPKKSVITRSQRHWIPDWITRERRIFRFIWVVSQNQFTAERSIQQIHRDRDCRKFSVGRPSRQPSKVSAALLRFYDSQKYRNWGRSEMIATQHAVVQAKAYTHTLKRRAANVAKLALLDAPIAKY